MNLGIICWCKSEKPKKFFKKIRVYEAEPNLTVAELTFKMQDRLKDKKIRKEILKAVELLKGSRILLEQGLENWAEEFVGNKDLFYKLAPRAAEKTAMHFDVKEPFALAVREKNAGEKTLYIIRKLIFHCGRIKIFTEKPESGQKISQKLMNEFGAVAEVLPYNSREGQGITVDLDCESIWLYGKSELKNFEIQEENYGFDVDLIQIYSAKNKDFDKIVIKSCVCGKNKLTLKEF